MTKTPCFDPRLRAGGDSRRTPRPSRRICFDPRLRAGGDLPVRVPRDVLSVSIHASAQEATTKPQQQPCRAKVSIHASAQEATALLLYQCARRGNPPNSANKIGRASCRKRVCKYG